MSEKLIYYERVPAFGMTINNTTGPEKSGQRNQPSVADDRPAAIEESMESVQNYKKIIDKADQLRDLKRRVKAWETEMERTGKANIRTMRQRARGYY